MFGFKSFNIYQGNPRVWPITKRVRNFTVVLLLYSLFKWRFERTLRLLDERVTETSACQRSSLIPTFELRLALRVHISPRGLRDVQCKQTWILFGKAKGTACMYLKYNDYDRLYTVTVYIFFLNIFYTHYTLKLNEYIQSELYTM